MLPLLFLLTLSACDTMRKPSASNNPSAMSSDTLCFRDAGAKKSPEIKAEIRARNLDCRAIIENDPMLNHGRY